MILSILLPIRRLIPAALCLLALLLASHAARAADRVDATPRTAVISAFPPELQALLAHTRIERSVQINGTTFTLGEIGGEPVVLFSSGVSMVNAAMTAQLALDRFTVRQIVFTGIAGGVDPALGVGDVVVAERWGQYLEAVFARDTPEGYRLPDFAKKDFPNFAMVHPQPVEVRNAANPDGVRMFWFPVDAGLLERAKTIAGKIVLGDCVRPGQCLHHKPRFVVGGNGVSGQAFVDNAAFREYVRATFDARLLDMETAAVAAVAFSNSVPFIAFRSLSDLAGGEAAANEMTTFMGLASINAAAALETFLSTKP